MSLVRYRPGLGFGLWPAMPEMPTRLGRVFDEMMKTDGEGLGWSPAVDVVEREGELLLSAELPGMKRDDIQIDINEGMLTIRGEKKVEREEKTDHARLVERSYGMFERSFALPRTVAVEKIHAGFADGVLTVHMPKSEQAVGRKVEIKAQ
jgi:HSP20 family protein